MLSRLLRSDDRFAEAIEVAKSAVQTNEDSFEAIIELSVCHALAGHFDESLMLLEDLAERRVAETLGDSNDGGVLTSIRAIKRRQAQSRQLDKLFADPGSVVSPEAALNYMETCLRRGDYVAGLKLLGDAEIPSTHVFFAASLATLGSVGKGDGANLSDAEREKLRTQALQWLESEKKQIDEKTATDYEKAAMLETWLFHGRLAGIRGEIHLDALPEDEQQQFAQFWDGVRKAYTSYGGSLEKMHSSSNLPEATAASLTNNGLELHRIGKFKEAEEIQRESLEIKREILGDRHPAIADAMVSLGKLFRDSGRLEESEKQLRDAIQLYVDIFNATHRTVAEASEHLADTMAAQGDLAAAIESFETSLSIRLKNNGEKDILVRSVVDKVQEIERLRKPSTRFELVQDNYGIGLRGVNAVKTSPNGNQVYSCAWDSDTIVAFDRDSSDGKLNRMQTLYDGSNLNQVVSLNLPPSGNFLVSAAQVSGTVQLARRDPQNGRLDVASTYAVSTENYRGAFFAQDATFSPDGKFVYFSEPHRQGADGNTGAITVLRRDGDDMVHVDTHFGQASCFVEVRGTIHHPNNRWVYFASSFSNSIVARERNQSDGRLVILQILSDDSDHARGLEHVFGVTLSPKGRHLYSVSGRFLGDNAVSVFEVQEDGTLSVVQEFIGGVDDCMSDFLGGNVIVVSPDGKEVAASGTRSSTIVVFDRNPESGKLTYAETVPVSSGPLAYTFDSNRAGPAGMCYDPSGEFLYVALEGNRSIAVYRRKPSNQP